MKLKTWVVLAFMVLSATTMFAQGTQTATLIGTVTGPDGGPLPGVTVTAMSPALIGSRTTVTATNGDYVIRGLPPGDYVVTFEMQGLGSVEATTAAGLGSAVRVDATLTMMSTSDVISVTAQAPSALETTTVGHNTTSETVQKLPVGRTPVAIASLAGGVTGGDRENRTPVAGQLSINGGMAYDNNFMVNGVNVQDPIFGQTNNLFIEDAIQETQVLTSGISAEYGHFTGGVMNVVTKSGGNDFMGSARADLTKPEWRNETPYEKGYRGEGVPRANPIERKGDLGEVYSLTLGGPVVRDRLWFFGALRDEENTAPTSLAVTGLAVPRVSENRRYEIKLTGNVTPSHSLQASYVENPVNATHEIQVTPLELAAIGLNSTRLNEGISVNYTGVLSSQLFAEARYSEKIFGFRGLGGTAGNIVDSPMRSLGRHQAFANQAGAGTFNAPYFDATDPENRDNEQLYGALSYYLSTDSMGSHDLKAGAERFTVTRTGGNSQSSTDYVFYTPYLTSAGTPVYDASGRLVPQFISRGTSGTAFTALGWWVSTRGAQLDITTDSFFIQDRWDINPNWTVNLGVRHEQVASDVAGANVVGLNTDSTVPRLAVSFDPLANGKYKLDVSYAEYAGRYNPSIVGRNTPVGSPALLYAYYNGPNGSGRDFAPGFDLNNYVFYYASVPTANIFQEDGLGSPVQEEITFSAGMALPKGGWLKATYIDRNLTDFIDDFITIDQGCTNVVFEGVNAGCFDNVYYRNTNGPSREYQAVMLQSRYNIMRNWMIEGNYTNQLRNHGDYEGEGGQSIGATPFGNRPELQSPRNNPMGRLSQYQEHKVRLWTTYTLGLGRAGALSTGLIYRYDSPLTFSYSTTVALSAAQIARNPGYKSRPTSQTLFFGDRGEGEFNDVSVFDLALNYSIPVFRSIEPWVKVNVTNLLDDDTQLTWNTAVSADPNSELDADGLRTGYVRGASFGRPTSAGSYVVPREYLVSAGIRF